MPNYFAENINYKQIILKQLEFGFRKDISNYYPTEIDIIEDLAKQTYLELRQYIWAEKLQETERKVGFTVRYPLTWWQHFKEAKFPQWLLKRYPVKEKTVYQSEIIKFERLAVFPEFQCDSKRDVKPFIIHEDVISRIA